MLFVEAPEAGRIQILEQPDPGAGTGAAFGIQGAHRLQAAVDPVGRLLPIVVDGGDAQTEVQVHAEFAEVENLAIQILAQGFGALARIRRRAVRGEKHKRVVPDAPQMDRRIDLGTQELPGGQHGGFRHVHARIPLQAVELVDPHIMDEPGTLGARHFAHRPLDEIRHPLEADLPAFAQRRILRRSCAGIPRGGEAGRDREIFVIGDQLHCGLALVVDLADTHFDTEIRAFAAQHAQRLAFGRDGCGVRQRFHQRRQFPVMVRMDAVDDR